MSRHTEAAFEGVIEAHLLANGYTAVPSREYDPARAIFPAFVLGFIRESQTKVWARLESLHGAHGQAVREPKNRERARLAARINHAAPVEYRVRTDRSEGRGRGAGAGDRGTGGGTALNRRTRWSRPRPGCPTRRAPGRSCGQRSWPACATGDGCCAPARLPGRRAALDLRPAAAPARGRAAILAPPPARSSAPERTRERCFVPLRRPGPGGGASQPRPPRPRPSSGGRGAYTRHFRP
jgi:hypothetical protein